METKTVAILFPGEMGHNVASVLAKHGLKVVTCLEGRSKRTRERAQKAGIIDLTTLEDVIKESDLIMSIVRPSAATAVGSRVAEAITKTGHKALFADLNAKSPTTSEAIGDKISGAGGRYIDGCIIGLSKVEALETKQPPLVEKVHSHIQTIFYVSGPYAREFTTLTNFGLHVEVLGDRVGQASAFKMLHAGVNKGRASLMIELLVTAYTAGIYEQVMDKYRIEFPELVKWLGRELIGTPFRAGRRGDEMAELARFVEKEGYAPHMALASWKVLKMVEDLDLRSQYSDEDETHWSPKDVIAMLSRGLRSNPSKKHKLK